MLRIVNGVGLGLLLVFSSHTSADVPATVAEAKATIDLTTFPTFQLEGKATLRIAMQRYQAKGSVGAITPRIQQELIERGWKATGSGVVTDAYASESFTKQGFTLSLLVTPGSQPDLVAVNLVNLGNLDPAELPRLPGAGGVLAMPNNLIYYVESDVETVRKDCREMFESAGWSWFGDTTASLFMRRNAVRLQIMVAAAPNQNGKTMVQYTAEQLSAMIPVPGEIAALQYSDVTGGMTMDSPLDIDEFCVALSSAMNREKWQATMEHPFQNRNRLEWIFRSSTGELVACEIFEFEGRTRCLTRYMTPEELPAESKQGSDQPGQRKESDPFHCGVPFE